MTAETDVVKSCAISSNLEAYPQLIEEMQTSFGDGWGGLDVDDAISVLRSSHAKHMESVVIALGAADEAIIEDITKIVETAKSGGLRTIIVTQDISATSLHSVMRSGADDFLPYPLPQGGLAKSIAAIGKAAAAPAEAPAPAPAPEAAPMTAPEPAQPAEPEAAPAPAPEAIPAAPAPVAEPPVRTHNFAQPIPADPPAEPAQAPNPAPAAAEAIPTPSEPAPEIQAGPAASPTVSNSKRVGTVFPVLAMSGGAGASTFCVNLAWEMQSVLGTNGRVCVLDLGFQFGSAATYLDIARTDATFELFNSIDVVDAEGFTQALSLYRDQVAVLPPPPDAAPLELLSPPQIKRLVELAASQFDYVFIDLPPALVSWTEVVLDKSHLFFTLCELDMRTAQNALRFLRALKADDLPYEKVQFILNKAPKVTDLNGRSRVKRMADSLNIEFRWMLPDGGKHIVSANDQGDPLAITAARNPYRKEIRKIAENLVTLSQEGTDKDPAQPEKGKIQVPA